MEAITGVFKTRSDAEHALHEAHRSGIPAHKITLLTPGAGDQVDKEMKSVPVDSTEQPGMGTALGALMGGGVGAAGGTLLIALVPGLGPVTALGLLGAAILGAAGAVVGATVGEKAEESMSEGLPEDEIFVYEDALRKGRSVVVGLVEDEAAALQLRELLRSQGAESVDAAREQWWIGLRNAEESHYSQSHDSQSSDSKTSRNFTEDEKFFRMGFEAALHARTRCMEFDQVSAEMDAALEDVQAQYPGEDVEEPFTSGYQRGREHYQKLCDENTKAA
jgi:hypothetical protein